ncbi:hypothetical protein WCE39_08070 [Luteimonas sp. MJ174]|uniref:hypothetical protein n=1 Tax=Luteimonas sp. MJ174 TaxID=3129237 RepID=UPI0031BABA12
MSDESREYLRDLAMHVLAECGVGELTAAEVAERMGVSALADGHPKRAWSGIDGWTVSGVLRRLENDGLAVRGGTVRSARKGRDEPTYRIAAHAVAERWPVPLPPEHAAALPPLPDGQVLVSDARLLGGAIVRHTADASAIDQGDMGEPSRWADLSRAELEALLDYADAQGDVTRAAALLTAVRSGG